jgi:hypothetical protein
VTLGSAKEVRVKFLRKRDEQSKTDEAAVGAPVCEHVTLIPKWDRAEDIGREDKISMYRCESCGAEFSLDEALALRETESARIQRRIAS